MMLSPASHGQATGIRRVWAMSMPPASVNSLLHFRSELSVFGPERQAWRREPGAWVRVTAAVAELAAMNMGGVNVG